MLTNPTVPWESNVACYHTLHLESIPAVYAYEVHTAGSEGYRGYLNCTMVRGIDEPLMALVITVICQSHPTG